ncbi:MAG: ADP/ATP-dependent (S)-NAD(P)H-hydrate dehydratase, partial [Oscillospiraceae bacterium]
SLLNTLQVPAVITPHIAEMARLASLSVEQVNSNTIKVAKLFAIEQNVVVVLKCHRTIIATPDGEIFQNTTGNAGLAKGGSGDVLAGMIAGLMAQGLDAKDAAICGVYLHGLCADRLDKKMSQYSFLARDLIEEIPYALKSIDR